MRHEQKSIVVTGANSGMGLAICQRFLREGGQVYGVDVDPAIVQLADRLGPRFHPIRADVRSDGEVEAVICRVVDEQGRLDVLCNNAGATRPPTPLTAVTEEDYDFLMDVNLRGVFLGLKYGIRAMLRAEPSGGVIVNIASAAARTPLAERGVYGAAKAGVISMTRAATLEVARHGIRINAISPGATRTAILDRAIKTIPGVLEETTQRIPASRLCEPDEVAAVASFLASDEASYVFGAVVAVDGGLSLV